MNYIGEYSNHPTKKGIRNEMAREIEYQSSIYMSLWKKKSPAITQYAQCNSELSLISEIFFKKLE